MQSEIRYEGLREELRRSPKRWMVTGAAGFIGSHVVEELLGLGQYVTGVDNFSSGGVERLSEVEDLSGKERWGRFEFIEGDISQEGFCRDLFSLCGDVDYVLHEAAYCSVPGSMKYPSLVNAVNVGGHLTLLDEGRKAGVKRFVYASSSAVYGDCERQPCVEGEVGRSLSVYGLSKYMNELYADLFARSFRCEVVGLRYFNVYGPRQSPDGAYAAVIPKWINRLLEGEAAAIYGDGLQRRDFCYVKDVVQANLLAAVTSQSGEGHDVFNVGRGDSIDLKSLYEKVSTQVRRELPDLEIPEVVYEEASAGDIFLSCSDVTHAQEGLGFSACFDLDGGLAETVRWFVEQKRKDVASSDAISTKNEVVGQRGVKVMVGGS